MTERCFLVACLMCSILCKVRGDQRVHVKSMERVATEMGSVLGNVEEVRDKEESEGLIMERMLMT